MPQAERGQCPGDGSTTQCGEDAAAANLISSLGFRCGRHTQSIAFWYGPRYAQFGLLGWNRRVDRVTLQYDLCLIANNPTGRDSIHRIKRSPVAISIHHNGLLTKRFAPHAFSMVNRRRHRHRDALPPGRSYRRHRKRNRLMGCLGTLIRLALIGIVGGALFIGLMAAIYVVAPPPRTNILVLGVDARAGDGWVTRSDTILLATVDPSQPYVGMMSIPRDLYLNIPGYGDNRINAAHILGESAQPGGGLVLAEQTVEQNFGVPVHRTVRLNFEAFIAIIDAAGGVTIDVPNSFTDFTYPTPDYGTMVVSFEAGEQTMDGERALQYARIRHGASDFERVERQQQVIEALAAQLVNPANWWRLPGVYLAFAEHVETNLTVFDAALLAPAVLWVGPSNIDRHALDRGMAVGTVLNSGASVLQPQWDLINRLVQEMFQR